MIEDFQNIEIFTPSIFDIAGNILIATICGLIISMVYRLVYKGPSYSPTFVNSLVLLSMITAVVILVIGNNLARAFGLVGAMSIIRFRTAVRDTQDIIFIFFSLTVGMAAGVGLSLVAIMATVLISAVIILLVSTNFSAPPRRRHLLHLTYAGSDEAEETLTRIIKKYCRKIKLVNLKTIGPQEDIDAFYHVTLRNTKESDVLIRALKALDFTRQINLYLDEDHRDGTNGA